jgi:hypothetical protein
MISHATTIPGVFQILTWDGSEEELRAFAGPRFLRLGSDGSAYCLASRDGIVHLYPGDYVLKLDDPEAPLLWIYGDSKWLPALFRMEG